MQLSIQSNCYKLHQSHLGPLSPAYNLCENLPEIFTQLFTLIQKNLESITEPNICNNNNVGKIFDVYQK